MSRVDFDPATHPGGIYRLLNTVVVPRPIAWVSSRSPEGVDNLAPHSFFTVSCADPPIVQFTSIGRKDSLANSLAGAFETSADAVANFANVFTYDLGLDYYTKYPEQVNAVTAAEALAMAQKYLAPGRLIVVAVGDRSAIEPQLRKLNLGPVEVRDAEGKRVGERGARRPAA